MYACAYFPNSRIHVFTVPLGNKKLPGIFTVETRSVQPMYTSPFLLSSVSRLSHVRCLTESVKVCVHGVCNSVTYPNYRSNTHRNGTV